MIRSLRVWWDMWRVIFLLVVAVLPWGQSANTAEHAPVGESFDVPRDGGAHSGRMASDVEPERAALAQASLPAPQRGVARQAGAAPSVISLEAGELRTLAVDEITRVAVSDPDVVDVTIVSSNEVLLQAKSPGTTNLILWDRRGQHVSDVEVIDRGPQETEAQLRQLLQELKLPDVSVKRENGKLFLIGEVSQQDELDRLEQMLSAYRGVTNLVSIPAVPAPVAGPPPLVKLSVQVIEVNRSDLEKLGVAWSQSIALDEQAMSAASVSDTLLRIGQTVSRDSLRATLNALVQKNKARILAEPKLVTASGKAASSFIGLDVPVIQATTVGEATGAVTASIEFRKTGVLLEMTPNVLDDQRITTTLDAEVSGIDTASGLTVPVGSKTVLVPGFKVRKANTEVTTASGETIFIAGLLEVEDSEAVSQVPALGSIPVLGRLFRSPEVKSTQRELIIAVTPELMGRAEETIEKAVAVEEALAVAEVTASVEDPMLRYALQVQDRIADAIRYPLREKELGLSGRLKLRLHLFKDGTLGRALIAESSGLKALDLEAVKAAESQSPYPPFPSGLGQQDLWLELPVLFHP